MSGLFRKSHEGDVGKVQEDPVPSPISLLVKKHGGSSSAVYRACDDVTTNIAPAIRAQYLAVGNSLPWLVGITPEKHGKWIHMERTGRHAWVDVSVLTQSIRIDAERITANHY